MNQFRKEQDLQCGQVIKSEFNQPQPHVTIKYPIDPISSTIKNTESRKKIQFAHSATNRKARSLLLIGRLDRE